MSKESDMTITHPRPVTTRTGSIEWTALQAGLWIGKRDREFAGMIEAHWGDGFAATTRLGQNLGMFPTVEAAMASLSD
jgi:hypothetical protein